MKIGEKLVVVTRSSILRTITTIERNNGWLRTWKGKAITKRDSYKLHGKTWYSYNANADMYDLEMQMNLKAIDELNNQI